MLTYIFVCKLRLTKMWYYEKEFARVTIRVQARTIKEAYNLLIFKAAFHPKYMQQETTGVQILKEKGQNLDLQKEELSGNLKIKTF
jgi:hypothetical protein